MIKFSNVSMAFPVTDISSHSLQLELMSKLGGIFGVNNKQAYLQAISGVDFEIKSGERVGIIGHNGSGKTTLLRMISGVYSPDSGDIVVDGSISALTDFTLGMDPNVSGYDNILFRLSFMGFKKSEALLKVSEIIEFSELSDFIHLPVRTYSTGMYMRLAFAISTSFTPDILLCDEVIGVGDLSFREKSLRRIESTLSSSRILVLSSHDLGIVRDYCTRIFVMKKGEIIYDGDVESGIKMYEKNYN
jgi:ABC-type polysaccharide/polyol phosphate transport system ATPase subunit